MAAPRWAGRLAGGCSWANAGRAERCRPDQREGEGRHVPAHPGFRQQQAAAGRLSPFVPGTLGRCQARCGAVNWHHTANYMHRRSTSALWCSKWTPRTSTIRQGNSTPALCLKLWSAVAAHRPSVPSLLAFFPALWRHVESHTAGGATQQPCPSMLPPAAAVRRPAVCGMPAGTATRRRPASPAPNLRPVPVAL